MFPFLDLPKNVREKIYRCHLNLPAKTIIPRFSQEINNHTLQSLAPLLLLCKQTSTEALPLLYGETFFEFWSTGTLHDFLRSVSLQYRRQIRKLSFHYCGQKINQSFILLKQLKGLRELHILLNEDLYRSFDTPRSALSRCIVPDMIIPQLGLKALLAPGMDTLRALRGLTSVRVETNLWDLSVHTLPFEIVVSRVLKSELTRPRLQNAVEQYSEDVQVFRFLSLPPELRRYIYILHLTVEGLVVPSKAIPTSAHHCLTAGRNCLVPKVGPAPPSVLALLEVSRQIHNEASPYFYSHNSMWLTDEEHMGLFLDGIGPDRAQCLTSIVIRWSRRRRWPGSMGVPQFDRLAKLKRLRQFHLILEDITGCEDFANCKIGDLPGMDKLRSIRGLDEVRVTDVCAEDWDVDSMYSYPERPEGESVNEIKQRELEEDLKSTMLLPREEDEAEAA
ncbi:MAG: hypothetical protein M1812_004865 [Candelaria pacifica]|nr:MAG: hypothetical protein M1812_004865 [Candelaria pacifica]